MVRLDGQGMYVAGKMRHRNSSGEIFNSLQGVLQVLKCCELKILKEHRLLKEMRHFFEKMSREKEPESYPMKYYSAIKMDQFETFVENRCSLRP